MKRLTAMKHLFARAAFALGISACAVQAASADPLEVGYMAIIPDSQLFVTLEQNAFPQNDGAPKLIQFQSGPAMIQALLAGQLDVAYLGIGPAMVARAKGADVKVVAANVAEQVAFVVVGELAPYFASGGPATAFTRFAADKGRPAVIASYPRGAMPETAFQYWLRDKNVDISHLKQISQGESQIEQSLVTQAIDGAIVLEPTGTLVLDKSPGARIVAHGSELFPHVPGAVLLVREKIIREQPAFVRALVKAHIAATDLLENDPGQAAPMVQKYVAGGRLPLKLIEESIRNSKGQFVADPNAIMPATLDLQNFQEKIGTLSGPPLDVPQMFDLSFYNAIKK
jgi:NitT/TauT family transport system substrate-binding protein